MPEYSKSEQLLYVVTLTSIALVLYLASLYNYLLFHSLIEIITIAIGFALFILTWNARKFMGNDFLKIIGIGYAFIAFIDLLHTLSYKGMNVFPVFDANLPTQLWIAARYLQAVTLCIAPLFVERTVGKHSIFASYTAVVALLVLAVYTGNFPDCFIDGKGLTVFKIGSEYVISALLLLSLYLFYRNRNHFTGTVFMLTASSIVCTVLSELSFTAYASVYGFANLAGHFCKLAAFYLIYRALLVTGLKEPFDLIFRELTQAKELLEKYRDTLEEKVRERTAELRVSEDRYRSLIHKVQAAIVLHDGQGQILACNPLAQELLGLSADQLLGKELVDPEWHFLRENGSILPVAEYPVSQVLSTRMPFRNFIVGVSCPGRNNIVWVLVNAEPEYDETGEIMQVVVSFVDITELKRVQETLHIQAVELEEEVAERQMAQESLQEQTVLLENEIEERRNTQDELEQLNENLEQRVQERIAELGAKNAELQKMNRLFVGRELRMVELKEKIREMEQLKNQLSQTVAQGEGDR